MLPSHIFPFLYTLKNTFCQFKNKVSFSLSVHILFLTDLLFFTGTSILTATCLTMYSDLVLSSTLKFFVVIIHSLFHYWFSFISLKYTYKLFTLSVRMIQLSSNMLNWEYFINVFKFLSSKLCTVIKDYSTRNIIKNNIGILYL